jgi:hypothetical protein
MYNSGAQTESNGPKWKTSAGFHQIQNTSVYDAMSATNEAMAALDRATMAVVRSKGRSADGLEGGRAGETAEVCMWLWFTRQTHIDGHN